jgi:hypothetical protein
MPVYESAPRDAVFDHPTEMSLVSGVSSARGLATQGVRCQKKTITLSSEARHSVNVFFADFL